MTGPSRFSALLVIFGLVATVATICWTPLAAAQPDDPQVAVPELPRGDENAGRANESDLPPTTADAQDSSQGPPRPSRSKDRSEVEIARAIQDLASAEFRRRQAAHRLLVVAGTLAIDELEKSAKTGQLETATRCVEALVEIARDENSEVAALAALERLARDPSSRIAKHAARAVTALRTTDEDRAIAALTAEGVRIIRDPNGDVFSVSVARDGQLAFLKHLPQLRSVRISGKDVTDAGMEYLADVKRLSSLTIMSSSVTDVGLKKLGALANLDELSLLGQSFTSEGLRHLQHVPKLKRLSLHRSIDESELGFLIAVPQINSLYLSNVRLSQPGVDIINQLDNLRRLTLSVSAADDRQLHWLGQLEVPLSLDVMRSPDITDAGWKHLEDAALLSLHLVQTPITDTAMPHIGAVRMLESLAITEAPISDAGLEHLQELKALKSLSLRNTNVTDAGIARLRSSLPQLRHVHTGDPRDAIQAIQERMRFTQNPDTGGKNAHLLSARLTPEDAAELKKVPKLDTIFLMRNGTEDEDLVLLADVPMKGLVIDSLGVTDQGIKALEDHPTLESLSLWSSNFTDRSLESIARIRSLTKFTIHKAPITDEGVRGLIERLSARGKLETLNLFNCPNITNTGLKEIGQLTSLERLFLNNCDGLTSKLLEEIRHLKNLQRLEIDSIALDEADLIHLASLTKLEILGMSCSDSKSKLTDRGLGYVSQLPSLKSLTIHNARVTDKGVSHLIQLNGLQKLGLAHTEITDHGVAAIASALPNLLQLGLSGTKVTDSGMVHIGKLTELEWLWLDETQVGDEGIRQLDQLTKLQYAYLDGSRVSNGGHLQFRRAHPTTEILLK